MSIDFLNSIDLIIIISFFIFLISVSIFFYNIKKKKYKKWYINILIFRHFIFLSLITLLLNPILNFYSFETTKLMLGIFVDNSASMKLHQQPVFNNFKSDLNNFFKKIEKEIFHMNHICLIEALTILSIKFKWQWFNYKPF